MDRSKSTDSGRRRQALARNVGLADKLNNTAAFEPRRVNSFAGLAFFTDMEVYFPHKSVGTLRVDMHEGTKHFEPWWALVACDEGIVAYYAWFLKRRGQDVMHNKLWGAHISAVKGHEPVDKAAWKALDGLQIEYWYSNLIRTDNGVHAWLDVFSPDLADLRQKLGVFDKIFFHLTIGRLR